MLQMVNRLLVGSKHVHRELVVRNITRRTEKGVCGQARQPLDVSEAGQ